ncbi:SEC-C metal-binding domain-containing protein [Lacicoccus alkaliphilus]|uniref:Rho termination factor, N-terminal domain n=1 Tax=Lacicoccus alkaliphilus DSM 16010 TaxID=1123231 RepID=A0A1M7IH22_9BACL|nr:SEC-C metal-binding domain-containing protein [Salinicoccus alkaliphilus]SHM39969.1 Rho termination factor, N-terminal domain [Salinicoccus alkaliphilus DSM 16010]
MTNAEEKLKAYNMNDLKRLAKTISVKNYSTFKKDDLIKEITATQKQPETALYAYKYIDEASFSTWKQAAETKKNEADYSLEEIFGLYIMGYAFEDTEKEDHFYLTDTVVELYNEVDTIENMEARLEVQRRLNLIRAALHLYGIVSFEQLIHLFKKYYDEDVTSKELVDFLEGSPYDISIDEDKAQIVIDDMNYAQYEMVRKLQGDRPYYEPEFGKFIKFSDPNYIDESSNHKNLKEWIKKNVDVPKSKHESIYISLLQLIMRGEKQDEIIKYLMSLNVEFSNVNDQREFFDNVAGIVENTRHFKYRGHKESELKTKTIVKEVKVGRNDPCPCGSGKKYKKCCGA